MFGFELNPPCGVPIVYAEASGTVSEAEAGGENQSLNRAVFDGPSRQAPKNPESTDHWLTCRRPSLAFVSGQLRDGRRDLSVPHPWV